MTHRLTLLAACVLAAAGCNGDTGGDIDTGGGKKAGPTKPGPKPAQDFATGFLKRLAAGEAKADDFTDEFLKVVARPTLPEDKQRGHDPAKLRRFGNAEYGVKSEMKLPDGRCLRGPVSAGGTFALRVTETGDGPRVSWLHVTGVAGRGPGAAGEAAAALCAARLFLDAAIAGRRDLYPHLLAGEFRRELAGIFGDKRVHLKVGEFMHGATGYEITESPSASKNQATVTANLTGGGTLTIDLASAGGRWRVAGLSKE